MLTSQHWPEGAHFLDAVDAFTRKVANLAKGTTLPDFCAVVQAHGVVQHGRITRMVHRIDLPHALDHLTRHQALALHHDREALSTACAAFLREAASLQGLQAYGRLPLLSYATAGPYSPYADGGRGGIFLQHASARGGHQALDVYQIDAQTPFHSVAQKMLHAIDTLCDRTPHANAPTWSAFVPDARGDARPLCPPFKANTQEDAVAIAPILAWDWTDAAHIYARPHP